MGVDARVDLSTPALGVLTGVHGVGVENTSQFDIKLNGAVLVKDPVNAVLVVSGGENV